jgi:hypothetical protein
MKTPSSGGNPDHAGKPERGHPAGKKANSAGIPRIFQRAVEAWRKRKQQQELSAQAHWRTAPGSRAAWKKLKKLVDTGKQAPESCSAVVHPTSYTLCTTEVQQVGAFAEHYRALFRTPTISSESEAAQRERSTATVHRLRQDRADDDLALGASFSLEKLDQALSRMANHKDPGADGVPRSCSSTVALKAESSSCFCATSYTASSASHTAGGRES